MLKQRIGALATINGSEAVHWTFHPTNDTGTQTLADVVYCPYKETIDSTYGRWREDNFVEHVKEETSYLDNTYVYKTDDTPDTPSTYYAQSNRLLGQIGTVLGRDPVSVYDEWFQDAYPGLNPYSVPWRDSFAKGFQAMWPKVEKQLDETIGNFTYELPKSASTAMVVAQRSQKLFRIIAASANNRNTLRTLLRNVRANSRTENLARALLGGIARTSLAWEFGVRPLMEDIAAIHNAFMHVKRDLDRLLKQQNKILRTHWSTTLVQPYAEDRSHKLSVGGNGEFTQYYLNAYVSRARYTTSMKYRYSIDQVTKRHLKLLGFLDAYGVGGMGDPQMLWDALPFSFVIDYFAHVGNFLGQFADRGIKPSVEVLGLSHSFNLVWTRDLHMQVYGAQGSNSGKQLAHVKKLGYYIRESPWYGSVSGIATRGFSKYNVRMLGTLIAALTNPTK